MGCGASKQRGLSNPGAEDASTVPDSKPTTATVPAVPTSTVPDSKQCSNTSNEDHFAHQLSPKNLDGPVSPKFSPTKSNGSTGSGRGSGLKGPKDEVSPLGNYVPKRRASKPMTFIPEDTAGSLKLLDVVLVGGSAGDASRALCSSQTAGESLKLRLDKHKDEKDSTVVHENRCFCFSGGYMARVHFHPVTKFSDQLPTFPVAQLVSTACVVLPRVDCPETLKSLQRRVTEIRARVKMACAADPNAPSLLMCCLQLIGSDQTPQEEQTEAVEKWIQGLDLPVLAGGETLRMDDGDALFKALAVEVTGMIFARCENQFHAGVVRVA